MRLHDDSEMVLVRVKGTNLVIYYVKGLEPGNFAYCCLGVMPDKRIACLYDTVGKSGYERIVIGL